MINAGEKIETYVVLLCLADWPSVSNSSIKVVERSKKVIYPSLFFITYFDHRFNTTAAFLRVLQQYVTLCTKLVENFKGPTPSCLCRQIDFHHGNSVGPLYRDRWVG
jgi:hypothetical protein